jgi:O-acetyl-ADP-ribose deacetylase (regulator of RNase III)
MALGIRYVTGDATQPQGSGAKVIVHICNDVGVWGKGFVLALSKRWSKPEQSYRAWAKEVDTSLFALGEVQFVQVEPELWVANLVGQHGIKRSATATPIRYDAVRQGLSKIASFALQHDATIHMPRIGTGLAGGNWEQIKQIIEDELVTKGLEVTVYTPPAA